MEKLHRSYRVLCAQAEETLPEGMPPAEAPVYLAKQKAAEVFGRLPEAERKEALVIGADTVVICGGRILGKPHSAEEAADMLRLLSGKTHEVVTGVCLLSAEKELCFASETLVRFYPLSEAEILAYVAGGEPMDKAGAYGIQGDGALFVEGIEGDYYTVVGFPVAKLRRKLAEFEC